MVSKKSVQKTRKNILEKAITKVRKLKNKSFGIYLLKLLRSIHKENFILRRSIEILHNFVYDMIEKIAAEADRLVVHEMKKREIHSAIKLQIPGELAKHANIEAMKAINLYEQSKQNHES